MTDFKWLQTGRILKPLKEKKYIFVLMWYYKQYILYILWCTTSALHMPKSQQCINLFTGYGYSETYTGVTFVTTQNGAFIYAITSLYKLILQQSLNSNSVCLWQTFSNGFIIFWTRFLTVFFLQPYQHTETQTRSTVAACFLCHLSPSIRVRLGFVFFFFLTPIQHCQGANVLFWHICSLLFYLYNVLNDFLFTLAAGTVCTVYAMNRLGPISSCKYLNLMIPQWCQKSEYLLWFKKNVDLFVCNFRMVLQGYRVQLVWSHMHVNICQMWLNVISRIF